MSETVEAPDGQANERRILFVEQIKGGDVVLMTFKDPAPRYAVLGAAPEAEGRKVADARGDGLDVLLLPSPAAAQTGLPETKQDGAEWLEKNSGPEASPPVFVRYRGVEVLWLPGRATLQCDPEQAELLLAAVVEFSYYECELRRIEAEIADGWVELEQDKGLAFDVTPGDLKRGEAVGGRMERTLQRRIRYARIESHLYAPAARLAAASQRLGEELREKAWIEARLETVDGQIEVFEHVYEMSSQRMGEYRAARESMIVEWVIVILLAAEALLMLAATVWRPKG